MTKTEYLHLQSFTRKGGSRSLAQKVFTSVIQLNALVFPAKPRHFPWDNSPAFLRGPLKGVQNYWQHIRWENKELC